MISDNKILSRVKKCSSKFNAKKASFFWGISKLGSGLQCESQNSLTSKTIKTAIVFKLTLDVDVFIDAVHQINCYFGVKANAGLKLEIHIRMFV